MFKLEISKAVGDKPATKLQARVIGKNNESIDTYFIEQPFGQKWKAISFPDFASLLKIEQFQAKDIEVSLQRLVDIYVFGDDKNWHSFLSTSDSCKLTNEISWTAA
ncbi:hypothetical protein [Flocculibacter collagenilyticus]|uniref:hypothetical protein n=1 Tax=Flocculibacter collagenilyticus TaxID=2744479 RepID=UPI0018F7700F|nr:hypothetical protein [Flocculibacter collagenilyticus]